MVHMLEGMCLMENNNMTTTFVYLLVLYNCTYNLESGANPP